MVESNSSVIIYILIKPTVSLGYDLARISILLKE